MITVSLCMIVRNEEERLGRCLDSIRDLMDEIVIVDTGSTDRTKEIAAAYTDHIYDFEWIDDFSAARNESFRHATKEYVMWLDADDYLLDKDREAFAKLKETLDPDYDSVLMDYVLTRDIQGNPQLFTRRNRLVKRAKQYRWIHPIHEILAVQGVVLPVDIAVTHGPAPEDSNPERNLNILKKFIERSENGAMSRRSHFYLASEYMDLQRWDEAVDAFESFLRRGADNMEDHIAACGHLAHCYRMKQDSDQELRALLRTFEADVPRADFCCRIGLWFEEKGEYETAIYWYETALTREVPANYTGMMNRICWTWAPHVQLTLCHGKLGNLAKAYEHNEKALSYLPDEPNLLNNKAALAAAAASAPPKPKNERLWLKIGAEERT